MKFDEYERRYRKLYSDFAKVVREIIEAAINGDKSLTRPQAYQARAKAIASLKKRLEEEGLLEAEDIELLRKDLAGVRLIFYANTDKDGFLQSPILANNFEIDHEETRIHTPTAENNQRRYRATHFIVSLKASRTDLPEYAKFKGLRAEVQVQTVLNHAWSETEHDMLYKREDWSSYGSRFMDAIKDRLFLLMDQYLVPAGFELDRVLRDFRRLKQGKEIFEQGPIEALGRATTHKERVELLSTIREHVLPLHEKLDEIHPTLIVVLTDTVRAARTGGGEIAEPTLSRFGRDTLEDVIRAVLAILARTKFRDLEQVFELFLELYESATSDEERKLVRDAFGEYSAYHLGAWNSGEGLTIQNALLKQIGELDGKRKQDLAPLLAAVWSSLLATEMSGAEATTYNTVTLTRAILPPSAQLAELRKRGLAEILAQLSLAPTAADQRHWYSMAHSGLRLPSQGEYSDGLLLNILEDSETFLSHISGNIDRLSFDLLEEIDEDILWMNRRVRQMATVIKDERIPAAVKPVLDSIQTIHRALEANDEYVRYKTLVGFRGTFSKDWQSEEFDYQAKEKYRLERADKYIESFNLENMDEWIAVIERCVQADARDMATFLVFGPFLRRLSERKPAAAFAMVQRLSPAALRFLPAILAGLAASTDSATYQAAQRLFSSDPNNIDAIMRHWRSAPLDLAAATAALHLAITNSQDAAVIEALSLAVESHEKPDVISQLFEPALDYLIAKNDARWVHVTWFSDAAGSFFEKLDEGLRDKVLASIGAADKIPFQAERILSKIAAKYPANVWALIGARFLLPGRKERPDYEPVPYGLSTLGPVLAKDASLGVGSARLIFQEYPGYFRFELGRVLTGVFRAANDDFIDAMTNVIKSNTDDDIDFVLDVLVGFNGNTKVHGLLRDIVALRHADAERIAGVERAIVSTGVVSGEFGFVKAYREKKSAVEEWLDDERPEVKEFAARMIKQLERSIAWEQQRAEQDVEMRRRDFDNKGPDPSGDDDDGGDDDDDDLGPM